jgi:hypothetical protein
LRIGFSLKISFTLLHIYFLAYLLVCIFTFLHFYFQF